MHSDVGSSHGLFSSESTGKCPKACSRSENAVHHTARYCLWFRAVEVRSNNDVSGFRGHGRYNLYVI